MATTEDIAGDITSETSRSAADREAEWIAQHVSDGTTQRECRRCGSKVSQTFVRVYGDQNDAVYGCPECVAMSHLEKAAVGRLEQTPDGGHQP